MDGMAARIAKLGVAASRPLLGQESDRFFLLIWKHR